MLNLRLTRSRQDVQSFLSVLGGLRETRLTAVLGYLVSRFPREFGTLLGFEASPADEISVEESGEGDRYDVLIRASGETHIIEGKIGPKQNIDQLLRYIRSSRFPRRPSLTVVDDGSEFLQSRRREFARVERRVKRLDFVTWTDVAKVCQRLAKSKNAYRKDRLATLIAQEFFTHLQENNMTHENYPEIYLRDIGDVESVQLYFRHNIYKCQPKYFNSARGNLYFAPYFTQQTAGQISKSNLVPVGEGISFVSRVRTVQVVETKDVLACLKTEKHPDPEEAVRIIRKTHKGKQVLLMTLGEPRLLFVSPITKTKLHRVEPTFTNGAMGSRSCTFDLLLQASQ